MTAVTSRAAPLRRRLFTRARIDRGILVTLPSLILALAVLHGLKPRGIGYFDVASITSSAAPLAFAVLGQTLVVVCGGLDLSAGAVLSLVNVTLVTILGSLGLPAPLVAPAAVLLAVAVGTIAGAVNGILVGLLNLPSIVVTLAVMFIAQGLALLVLPTPGGEFADAAAALIVGDAVPGLLPAAAVAIVLAMAAWLLLKRTRLGIALCATGSDPESAHANGIRVPTTRVLAFTLAGAAYGLAGFAVTANTGSGDPLIGAPMLLKIFAAVVLGGVAIGGGRGSAIGAILGAVTLTTVTTLLLVSGIQTYYAPIVEGAILLGAVLLLSAGRESPAIAALRESRRSRAPRPPARTRLPLRIPAAGDGVAPAPRPRWSRLGPFLRMAAPSYALFLVILTATAALYGSGFSLGHFLATLLVFTTFLAILGLGQGAVVIAGGLDLSVGWAITLPAVVLTASANGSDFAGAWAVPLALAIGLAIGLVNGALVVGFALSPVIVTLATAGALEGITLVYSHGAPTGYGPPSLGAFVNGQVLGLPLLVWFLLLFVLLATLLLNRSVFGRRLVAVGSNAWAARLSGVNTGGVAIAAYGLSGFCAALAGVLLVGFNSQANYDMGKPYLLASVAAVVLGGTDIRGGRGHYLGIFGGALLFTALGAMLSATSLPEAIRNVVYGVVLLVAVLASRPR